MALIVPNYGSWVFAAAVIAGVFPFARKALALTRSGSPFSIETLMTVAALGALVIGEAEEAAAVVFLFSIGELLETVAAGRARAGIKALASLVPKRSEEHTSELHDLMRISDAVFCVKTKNMRNAEGYLSVVFIIVINCVGVLFVFYYL